MQRRVLHSRNALVQELNEAQVFQMQQMTYLHDLLPVTRPHRITLNVVALHGEPQ